MRHPRSGTRSLGNFAKRRWFFTAPFIIIFVSVTITILDRLLGQADPVDDILQGT